jgi:hypothetical protein
MFRIAGPVCSLRKDAAAALPDELGLLADFSFLIESVLLLDKEGLDDSNTH